MEKSNINASLANNVDLNGAGNLTAERRAILEKNLKLVEAKIEKGFLQEDPDNSIGGEAYVLASSLGFVFTVVILIIIAGSMMSHEMSTGTIKSLIIAPVKRWKIYLAKYLSLIATMVLLILYTYGISSLTNGLLFGFSSFGEKVFIVSGNAVTMNYFSYQFLSALCNLVPLFIFATFAYTLSIVTKKYRSFCISIYGTVSWWKFSAFIAGVKPFWICAPSQIFAIQQFESFWKDFLFVFWHSEHRRCFVRKYCEHLLCITCVFYLL